MGNPLPLNLAQECRKAEKILAEFVDPVNGGLDRVIPMSVLRKAQGLAIFSVARLGFLMSARAGSGVVVARSQDDSWSAPSAIGLGGVGAGFNAGLDVTDFVIVLNSKQAVRSFMATGSLQLGGNLSVAVGPLGRAAEATGAVNSSGNLAAMFSYSKSKGLYGGVSVEGTILIDRSDANSKAYHRSVTAKQILSGSTEVPGFSSALISLIEKYTMTGQVRTDMDGRSASARGYGNYDDNDVDSLDREFRATDISSRNTYSPSEEYEDRNPFSRTNSNSTSGYAFGSGQGGSMTNSPTRTKKSFLGGNSSNVRGTDYGSGGGGQSDSFDLPYTAASTKYPGRNTSSNDTFARSGVQARRTSASAGLPFTYDHENNSRIRSQKAFANFPTKFERDDTDEDEGYDVKNGNASINKDPFDFVEDSYSSQPSARRSPLSSRRRDPVQPPQADLIDFGADDESAQRSTYGVGQNSRRRAVGMDSLDEELQQRRESVDTDESRDRYSYEKTRNTTATAGWRADYGLPDDDYAAPPPPTRPPMHQRTSSAQKLWNRVRGNSQSAQRSAFAEAWEARQSTNGSPKPYYSESSSRKRSGSNAAHRTTPSPGPDYLGRGTTPPAAIIAAAIGRTGSATPTATYMSESRSHRGTPPIPAMVEVQVLAQFDFIGEEENDLSFKRGDVIDILRKTDNREDWWLGRSADGRMGK